MLPSPGEVMPIEITIKNFVAFSDTETVSDFEAQNVDVWEYGRKEEGGTNG